MKKMKEEKQQRIFSGAKGSFFIFKAINVGNVVLVNKEKLASQNTTVRLCRYMRSL